MAASLNRNDVATVAGLAFLWPLLHASPYFPVSLAFNSNTADVDFIAGCHSVYTLLFVLVAAAFAAFPDRIGSGLARLRPAGIIAGLLGSLGCGLLVACGQWAAGPLTHAALGCAMMCVALFVVCAVVAWGVHVGCGPSGEPAGGEGRGQRGRGGRFARAARLTVLSYMLFSVVWLLWVWLAPSAAWLLAVCPLISGACLTLLAPAPPAGDADRAQRPAVRTLLASIPHALVWPCVVLVYVAVILVRALTTMQAGMSVGSLDHGQQTVSALIQVVVVVLFGMLIWLTGRQGSVRCTFIAMGALVLLFLGALLQVVLTGAAQESSFLGRRTLVAAEHCLEVLLFFTLAHALAADRAASTRAFALFAVVVLAVPQFVSLDLMYRTGLLESLSNVNQVVPITAVASFAVAALLIGLLTVTAARGSGGGAGGAGDLRGEGDGLAGEPAQGRPGGDEAADRPDGQSGAGGPADPAGWQAELCRAALAEVDVSPREFDVALLAYRGYSARNIARQLAVSESTVKTHLTHVYRKLGIHSRQELIELIDARR